MHKFLVLIAISFLFVACNFSGRNQIQNSIEDDTIVGDTAELIVDISNKIRVNPRSHKLFFERANLQFASNNIFEAINDLEIALKLDSLNAQYMNALGECYLEAGFSGKSVDILLKCSENYPENRKTHFQLAEIYFYVQQYDDAFSQLSIIESKNKQGADTYFLKGLIYRETGKDNLAIKSFRKSIEYDSEHWEAYNLIGLIYYENNDSLSVEYYNTAVRLFPDNLEICLNRAITLQNFDKIQESISQYNSIIERFPDSFQAKYNLGYVYLVYTDDYDSAIQLFSDAIAIDSLSGEAFYNRGYAFELNGNFAAATADYYKSLDIIPNYELAISGLNNIDQQK